MESLPPDIYEALKYYERWVAGAEIILELTDMHYGDRVYCALDGEGHFWTFATHMRDVLPGQM